MHYKSRSCPQGKRLSRCDLMENIPKNWMKLCAMDISQELSSWDWHGTVFLKDTMLHEIEILQCSTDNSLEEKCLFSYSCNNS